MGRDMSPVRDLLTPEIYETMQKDCDRMRAERHIDRMENIAVRSVDVTEAWQESGRDYVTVHFLASMLDYTIDERTQAISLTQEGIDKNREKGMELIPASPAMAPPMEPTAMKLPPPRW